MNRKSIKLLLLAIFALVFLQIGFAAKPTNKTTGKSKTTYSTKKLHYAKVSNCRVLDTLVELINQCKINEPWFDWGKYAYIMTFVNYVEPTDTIYYPDGSIGCPRHVSDSDLTNMFEGKEVSRDIEFSLTGDNEIILQKVALNCGGFNFLFYKDVYDSTKSLFNYTKRNYTFKEQDWGRVEKPIIGIIYKKTGEIEAMRLVTEMFIH